MQRCKTGLHLDSFFLQQSYSKEQQQARVNLIVASITNYLGNFLSALASLALKHLSGQRCSAKHIADFEHPIWPALVLLESPVSRSSLKTNNYLISG